MALLTREQRDDALMAMELLARSCSYILEIVSKLVHSMIYGAMNPTQASLMITPQVVTGLTTLQSAVSDLSRAYIAHTNAVLGKGSNVTFEQLNFPNPLGGDGTLFSARGPTPAPLAEPEHGKKRKRAPHDKNAPKRALTPFFLYLQSQRATIGKELGDKFTAKEIQDEGGKRWREMPEKEKAVSASKLSHNQDLTD